MSIFGFFGDFFLPKHFFRFVGRVGQETLPAGPEDGKKPNPKQVVTHFLGQAASASQTIGDRVFTGKAWAARRVPGLGMSLGGLTILGVWSCLVVVLLAFGYSRLLASLPKSRSASRIRVLSSQEPPHTATQPDKR